GVRDAIDVARELARRAVHLAAREAAPLALTLRLRDRCRLGEYAEARVIDHAVDAVDVADHVVVEDALDLPALPDRDIGHVLPAEQPLLLTRQPCIDDGLVEVVLREHARGL